MQPSEAGETKEKSAPERKTKYKKKHYSADRFFVNGVYSFDEIAKSRAYVSFGLRYDSVFGYKSDRSFAQLAFGVTKDLSEHTYIGIETVLLQDFSDHDKEANVLLSVGYRR